MILLLCLVNIVMLGVMSVMQQINIAIKVGIAVLFLIVIILLINILIFGVMNAVIMESMQIVKVINVLLQIVV